MDYRMKTIIANLGNCEKHINAAIDMFDWGAQTEELYSRLCSAYQALSIARHYIDRLNSMESPQKQPL